MNHFRFVLKPLTFDISANSSDPIEALREVLKCDTNEEELLLSYLAREINDHPTLDGSVSIIDGSLGSFCHIPVESETLRAPVFYPAPIGPSLSDWH